MTTRSLEADYVIIGAGASALAFADTLLDETDASMIIVDRRAAPGGHWTACYPFVRLHGPALNYGVNSRELGTETLDSEGFNAGLHQLPGGGDVRAYFEAVMNERLLPSGRVGYLASHEYANGVATGADGAQVRLVATRKIVDATYVGTQLPNEQPPPFDVAPGVICIAPHALDTPAANASYVVIGAGKTAMDTVVYLLTHGVDADAITWIRPRDAWILPREKIQPSYSFFAGTMDALAGDMEAARDAQSIPDLFDRLERNALLRRLDSNVAPLMFRCAIASDGEIRLMQQIENVVRKGRVTALRPGRITLEQGEIAAPAHAIHINCSADGNPRRAPQPVFADNRILIQYVRRCSPTFSAAMVAFIEANIADDAMKNAMTTPVPSPDEPLDWLRMYVAESKNRLLWSKSEAIQSWLARSRLDRFTAMVGRAMREQDPAHAAILARYSAAMRPAFANLSALLAAA